MFGAKSNMRHYLNMVAPWAENQWTPEKLNDPKWIAANEGNESLLFEIPTRPLVGWFERLLLGERLAHRLDNVIIWVNHFNLAATRYNTTYYTRIPSCKTAHGVVGYRGAGTLHDVWLEAMEAVR